MKKSNILIIGAVLLLSTMTITGMFLLNNFSNSKYNDQKPNIPKIIGCYNSIYGKNEIITQGYATLRYDYLLKNEKNKDVKFEIDWDDGTTTFTDLCSDLSYIPHRYKQSGTYKIKARYTNENIWSDSLEINMVDFYDLAIGEIYTKPSSFRPRQKIDLCVDIKNIGTISTDNSVKVEFYYFDEEEKISIGEEKVCKINSDGTESVEVSFRWFNDKNQYTIYVEVEKLDDEPFFNNNIDCEFFNASRIGIFKSLSQSRFVTKLRNFISNIL